MVRHFDTLNATHGSPTKSDLKTTFDDKDKKNRDAAFCKVIEDAKKLVKSIDIPPKKITEIEDALIYYVMLSDLDIRHFELFGITQGQSIPEDDKVLLYNNLTEEQKSVLKRDFLMKNMVKVTGISKKSALLLQLVTSHFPVEMEEIMQKHNSEYQSKRQVIQEQKEKICPETEELPQVA
jgi:ParB family chromosome partitioning protein